MQTIKITIKSAKPANIHIKEEEEEKENEKRENNTKPNETKSRR